MTRSSILFICNNFCCWLILSLSLYIELALVCCTNPDTVHSFGTIFPNLNFKQRCASFSPMGSNQKQRCGSQFAKWHDMTRGVRGQMKATQRWFEITQELSHGWFQDVWLHVHDSHWTGEFATVIWHLHCFTVSFRGDVRGKSGPRELTSVNSEFENSAMGARPIYKNYSTRLI